MAEEVNRNDGPGFFCDFRFNFPGIHIEGVRNDINKNRGRLQECNHLGRGNKGKRGGDDLIPRADPAGPQGQQQGICSAGHTRSKGNAMIGSDFIFQG